MPAGARVDRDRDAHSLYAHDAMLRRAARLLLRPFLPIALTAVAGCSADEIDPPEPAIESPGTFVAATDSTGVIVLFRTLRIVPLSTRESIYDAIVYGGEPSSYEQAKSWAKDPDWPVASPHSSYSYQQILSSQPEAVWFRSLTSVELAALF